MLVKIHRRVFSATQTVTFKVTLQLQSTVVPHQEHVKLMQLALLLHSFANKLRVVTSFGLCLSQYKITALLYVLIVSLVCTVQCQCTAELSPICNICVTFVKFVAMTLT